MIEEKRIDHIWARKILKNCPYYDDIITYEYKENDNLSYKLINWYKDLIFKISGKNIKELKLINILDKSLYLYTKDYRFQKELKNQINQEDLEIENILKTKSNIRKIINLTYLYEQKELLELENPKWL